MSAQRLRMSRAGLRLTGRAGSIRLLAGVWIMSDPLVVIIDLQQPPNKLIERFLIAEAPHDVLECNLAHGAAESRRRPLPCVQDLAPGDDLPGGDEFQLFARRADGDPVHSGSGGPSLKHGHHIALPPSILVGWRAIRQPLLVGARPRQAIRTELEFERRCKTRPHAHNDIDPNSSRVGAAS